MASHTVLRAISKEMFGNPTGNPTGNGEITPTKPPYNRSHDAEISTEDDYSSHDDTTPMTTLDSTPHNTSSLDQTPKKKMTQRGQSASTSSSKNLRQNQVPNQNVSPNQDQKNQNVISSQDENLKFNFNVTYDIRPEDNTLDRFLVTFLPRKPDETYNYFGFFYLILIHIFGLIGMVLGGYDLSLFIRSVFSTGSFMEAAGMSDYYILCSKPLHTFLFTGFCDWFASMGVTCAAHRYWAHRTFTASTPLRIVLLLMNSMACEKSVYHWCRDHRTHHRFSDTELDIHDSNRGLFYAHIGWLFYKKSKATMRACKEHIDLRDLDEDFLVQIQKRFDPYWNLTWCFVIPPVVAMYCWNESFWAAFLLPSCFRYMEILHRTWCVNSIVHTPWGGPNTYDENEPPSESRLVSFLACGEGWHSWHHKYAFDYKTSELSHWYQWNPTKCFIDVCYYLGLATKLKTGNNLWEREKIRRGIVDADEYRKNPKKYPDAKIEQYLSGPPMFKVRYMRPINNNRIVKKEE